MSKVIVTLTTIPERLSDEREYCGVKESLISILTQSYSNYEVHFNIPHKYALLDRNITLPDWLLEYIEIYPHLKVVRTQDYGPITKILPTLYRSHDMDDIIITVDDDMYYDDNMITYHLDAREKYEDSAIGFAGLFSIESNKEFITSVEKDTDVKILEGYKSISYKRGFFDIQELIDLFLYRTWRDDETLSAYLGFKKINKVVLNYDKEVDFTPRIDSFPIVRIVDMPKDTGCELFRAMDNYKSNGSIDNWRSYGFL